MHKISLYDFLISEENVGLVRDTELSYSYLQPRRNVFTLWCGLNLHKYLRLT